MRKFKLVIISAILFTIAKGQYLVSTVAGNGVAGLVDGAATGVAELNHPYGLAYDGDSVIYFSDGLNHVIRKLSLNTNNVITIAGNGSAGFADGTGTGAKFNFPDDVSFLNGFLYGGDNLNNSIRKIDVTTYSVTTVAGSGVSGYLDGPANQAQFQGGNGIALALAANGDIYVADGSNAVIRLISNGQVSTVAGTPGVFGYADGPAMSAKFHRPRYLELDPTNGDLYITDINNNVIRKLSGGNVSTFTGTGIAGATDGPANTARFSAPVGIARTYNGYFYVVDGGGNKLRKVSPNGTVSTIAGNGLFGFQDGQASSAEFYYPQDICYRHCSIYMADLYNNRLRAITIPEGPNGCLTTINEASQNGLHIYPNPTSGEIQIETEHDSSHYEVRNLMGQIVLDGECVDGKINISSLSNGSYWLYVRASKLQFKIFKIN